MKISKNRERYFLRCAESQSPNVYHVFVIVKETTVKNKTEYIETFKTNSWKKELKRRKFYKKKIVNLTHLSLVYWSSIETNCHNYKNSKNLKIYTDSEKKYFFEKKNLNNKINWKKINKLYFKKKEMFEKKKKEIQKIRKEYFNNVCQKIFLEKYFLKPS